MHFTPYRTPSDETKVTSHMVSTEARVPAPARPWPIPPARDCRGRGMCIFPRCEETCAKYQPCCPQHWRAAPDIFVSAITEAWRTSDQRRWLLAVEGLRCYWLSIAP